MTATPIEPLRSIWINGEQVPWSEARVHVLTHALHYGYGAFEGIRCYETADDRSAIFKLREHMKRFVDSAKILMIPLSYSREQLEQACVDTLRANGIKESYLRPLLFVGEGALGFGVMDNPTQVAIIAFKWGAYLGEEGLNQGIRAKVSTFQRPPVNVAMVKAKVIGQYANAILAKREATLQGFDEAILLDGEGYVTEGSGQNLFIVRDGVVKTPPVSSSVLPGITRDTVITLCREVGIRVIEEKFTRDSMYVADEVFLTGTASEVCPVREIDNRVIGPGHPGEITTMLQQRYADIVRGRDDSHREWLTFVD